MKKSWFIIEKDYHRGPYSFEDLKNLKAQGKLTDLSLLWQEGNTSGLTFAQAREVERKITETLIPDVPGFRPGLSEPPRLPGEQVFANEKFIKPTVQTAVLDKIAIPEVTKTPVNKVVGIYIASLLGLALFFGGGLFYFYIGRTPQLNFPTEMTQIDYERLGSVINTRFLSENIFELAPARDLSRLWLAINFPIPSELQLEMTSIKEMTWQNKEVKVRAKANLENYLAEFSNFIVESGDGKFYPGFYNLKISLVDTSDTNLMTKLIYRNKAFKDVEVKEFFWGQGSKEEFLELLKKSVVKSQIAAKEEVEEIESEVVQSLREKEEKLRTLLSLVNLTDEETKNIFDRIESENLLKSPKALKKALADYEKKYVKEVAPLLTSLGQDADVYEAQILGKLFVETLDSLKKQGKTKGKTKRNAQAFPAFAQNHLLKFKELEANLEANLKKNEDEITKQKTIENAQANKAKINQ